MYCKTFFLKQLTGLDGCTVISYYAPSTSFSIMNVIAFGMVFVVPYTHI